MSPSLPSPVLDALTRGWTVVTSTQRAARWLRSGFDEQQDSAGKNSWEPAPVYAWETWLGLLWRKMLLSGGGEQLLLNSIQEEAVWREVIEAERRTAGQEDMAGAPRSAGSLARTAAEAWKLLHAYRCRKALPSRADTSDTRAFARWAGGFDRICGRQGYVTAAELPEIIAAAIRDGRAAARTPGVLLVGFEAITPAQAEVWSALSERGVEVEQASEGARGQIKGIVKARDPEDERVVCARWLRSYLREHPEATVGVIVPSLAEERAALQRTFRHVLAPEAEDITAARTALPFEFSLGVPLASVPLVSTAMEILSWAVEPLTLERISAVLLSRYFAAGGEYLARAEFDAFGLRKERVVEPRLTIEQVANSLWKWRRNGATPELGRALRALVAAAGQLGRPNLDSHAGWGERFAALLEAAGWTRVVELDSTEFQAQRRWKVALDELATLDFAGRDVDCGTALRALREIMEETMFAPESRSTPVQVLGPLEATGLAFDVVWFLGAGDLGWPRRARANPLLPFGLQREHGMPGADGDRDTALARAVTHRIGASAPAVWFSYAAEVKEQHQRPSSLVMEFGVETLGSEEMVEPTPVHAPVTVVKVVDQSVVASPPEHGLHGGADLLKAQAACGFRAFAEKRLFSQEVGGRELGLNAMERGSLIHDALEGFWRAVKSQDELRRLSKAERDLALALAVDTSLERYISSEGEGWGRAYLNVERTRLLGLLGKWLEFEASRSPFVVKLLEQALREVQIGPLRVSVRVDRVDVQLADGEPTGEVVLDYKTGVVRPADWLGDRPDEPQLPLYAVVRDASEQPLSGVVFAMLRPGDEMRMAGFVNANGILPNGSRPAKMEAEDLASQVVRWREVLEELARQFHEGEAAVSPKRYPTTCRYCEQRIVCRLDAGRLEPEALDEMSDTDWEAQGA